MNKKLDLDDIEAIRRDPLVAARAMQELRNDMNMLLTSLESLRGKPADSVRSVIGAHVYNLRQQYPKT